MHTESNTIFPSVFELDFSLANVSRFKMFRGVEVGGWRSAEKTGYENAFA